MRIDPEKTIGRRDYRRCCSDTSREFSGSSLNFGGTEALRFEWQGLYCTSMTVDRLLVLYKVTVTIIGEKSRMKEFN